jgi:carbon storage regulator
MLVLSRRINEKIVMPTLGATVQVVSVKPGIVRIGIDAPDNVPVFRQEVLDRLDRSERARLVPSSAPLALPSPPNAGAEADKLRDRVGVLTAALATVAAALAQVRRQLKLGQTEDLGVVLDRLLADLRTAQHEATATEPARHAVAPVPAYADYVVI